MQTLELNNVGPVSHISIPVPENGGIVILRGRNGKGKTKTLEAVESAISGRGKLDVKDGTLNGEFKGFGVTIKVGSRTSRRGELEIQSLEGKLSVAELVDPGIKAQDAADIRRIKALVQLANVLPSADLFYPLVGSREAFEAVVGTSALASEDLVTMADRVKRDFHQAALKAESQAEHAEGRARGAREAAADVDVNVETDAATLQQQLNDAVRKEEKLKAERDAAAKAKEAAQLARDQLADAEATYDGPTLSDALAAEERAKAAQAEAEGPAKELSEQLQSAKKRHELDKQKLDFCETTAGALRTREGKAKSAHADAVAKVNNLIEQLRIAQEQEEAAAKHLKEIAAESEEAAGQADTAKDAEAKSRQAATVLESKLQAARQDNELACQAVAAAVDARKTAESHDRTMQQWRNQLATAELHEPEPADLEAAAATVARCNLAIEQATLARRAKTHLAEANQHAKEAKEARDRAVQLREAAKGTDDVLSEVVSKTSNVLRVEMGRLVLDTQRGATYFGELSHGERWKIALDIAIDAVGERGVLMIPQEAFESLDPTNRNLIRDHVTGRGVTILTAEASDDEEIKAEVLA